MRYLKEIAEELTATQITDGIKILELARALGEGVEMLRPEDFAPSSQKIFATIILPRAMELARLRSFSSDDYPRITTAARRISAILDDCSAQRSTTRETSQVYNYDIRDSTGVFGDVSNSNVHINDFSSIHRLLKQKNIPQSERNDLENIMDEMKTADPEKKKGLVESGKAWVAKNESFLGATASIVRKMLGLGEETGGASNQT
jgi:hypothetical protein